jgi:hypothetical protein
MARRRFGEEGASSTSIRQNVNSLDGLGNPPLSFTPTVYNGNLNNFGPGVSANGVLFPVNVNAFDKKGQIPTTYGYSLGIQHELPWQMGLDVAYVGNLSRHLQYQYNLQALPVGSVLNLNGLPTPDYGIYKGYNVVNFTSYGANASYNALQAKVTRRFHKNLTLMANYTWSKAIDLTDADSPGADGGSATALTDPYHLKRDYAVAGFDRTHAFNFNYVYLLPELRNRGALMKWVAGGWEISGITRFWSAARSAHQRQRRKLRRRKRHRGGSSRSHGRADLRQEPIRPDVAQRGRLPRAPAGQCGAGRQKFVPRTGHQQLGYVAIQEPELWRAYAATTAVRDL